MEGILNRITAIRRLKKISQKEIAKSLDISQAAYAKVESGQSILTIDRLYKIAGLLRVSVNELLDIEINSEETKKLKDQIENLKNDLNRRKDYIKVLKYNLEDTLNAISKFTNKEISVEDLEHKFKMVYSLIEVISNHDIP